MLIFDLDGTLSLVGDRIKFITQKKKDYDAFYDACHKDKVNEPVARIYRVFKSFGYDIKVVTGRVEKVRGKTLQWMWDHSLFIQPKDLHMRKDGDHRHDTLVKPELIESFKDDILMIFEDRTSMVQKWRELGYACFQVAEGDF